MKKKKRKKKQKKVSISEDESDGAVGNEVDEVEDESAAEHEDGDMAEGASHDDDIGNKCKAKVRLSTLLFLFKIITLSILIPNKLPC